MTGTNFAALRRFLVTLVIVLGVVSCATNPVTGKRELAMLSESDEIKLGRENDPKIRAAYGLYDDPALQAYVQQIGEKVAANSHRPELIYRFAVLDSPEVNAFALPGGYIYVTRGILAYLNSEAELAAVLGHEVGHVTARHSVTQISRAQAANLGFGIGSIFIPELRNQAAQSLFNVLGGAILSGYGREDELEADRLGAEYLARNGYDPEAMIKVIGVLKNQEEFDKERAKAEGRAPRAYHGVFATHPKNDQRLQEVVAEAKNFKTSTAARIGRDEFLKKTDGLIYGDGPKQGVRRGSSFYHGDMNFAIDFPKDWRLENNPQSVTAQSPERDAVMELQANDLNRRISPQEYLRQELKLDVRNGAPIPGTRLPSYSGIATINTPFKQRLPTRVSVVFLHNRAFVLFGTGKTSEISQRIDNQLLAAAASLRPLRAEEKSIAQGLKIRTKRAASGDTFDKLAQRSPIPAYATSVLRLINDKYPDGEPTAGEMIKVIE
jgi:predicted Zn-dependent protease